MKDGYEQHFSNNNNNNKNQWGMSDKRRSGAVSSHIKIRAKKGKRLTSHELGTEYTMLCSVSVPWAGRPHLLCYKGAQITQMANYHDRHCKMLFLKSMIIHPQIQPIASGSFSGVFTS